MIDDGLTDAERRAKVMKRVKTARGRANADARLKAGIGKIDAATQRTLDKMRERDGFEPW